MKKISLTIAVTVLALGVNGCSELNQANNLANAIAKPQTPASGSASSSSASVQSGSTAPVTYSNKARKFHFTIPAGWAKINGDPDSNTLLLQKVGGSASFQFHYTGMASNFPAEASVKASLNMAKDEVKRGNNIAAKRRDDKCQSNPKVLCARGWELIDDGHDGHQRIIWQAYDKDNFYYNFMGASNTPDFQAARATLQEVIESVKFD